MTLQEALAVYEYLKHRPPGGRSRDEERAFSEAWDMICSHAESAIDRYRT